ELVGGQRGDGGRWGGIVHPDPAERTDQAVDAETGGAREGRIEEQQLHHPVDGDRVAVHAPIRLERGGAAQYGRPLEEVDGAAHVLRPRPQAAVRGGAATAGGTLPS